jgi:hypothetical protein
VHVTLGGEPERDESGLPPVDIEIPDDARELDRDVQAYYRELRAQRRRHRRRWLHGPLTRDGIVLPLLAGCLVLALISGTLLTVFTTGVGQDLPGVTRPGAGRTTAGTNPSQRSAAAGTSLPAGTVLIDNRQVRLNSLAKPSVLVLVPAGCNCGATLGDLTDQAKAANVPVYLVGTAATIAQAARLARQLRGVKVADDTSGVLTHTYPPRGLTALLVAADGKVTVASGLRNGGDLPSLPRALATASPAASH